MSEREIEMTWQDRADLLNELNGTTGRPRRYIATDKGLVATDVRLVRLREAIKKVARFFWGE